MEEAGGWLTDVLECIQSIESDIFTLETIYKFQEKLSNLHPTTKMLRQKFDRCYIDNNGYYKRLK